MLGVEVWTRLGNPDRGPFSFSTVGSEVETRRPGAGVELLPGTRDFFFIRFWMFRGGVLFRFSVTVNIRVKRIRPVGSKTDFGGAGAL